MIAVRGLAIRWSVGRFRRRALVPAAVVGVLMVLLLTVGAANAMANVMNSNLQNDECDCSIDTSTNVSVPGDPPGSGLTFPNTGSAGLLGTDFGPQLPLASLLVLVAGLLLATGSLGLIVERTVVVSNTRIDAGEPGRE